MKKENNLIELMKIFFCKKSEYEETYTSKMLSIITALILKILGYSLLIFSVCLIFGGAFYFIKQYQWENIFVGVISIALSFLIAVVSFLFSALLVGAAKEQENNKDFNKLIGVFSAIVGFVALIISLVALLRA